MWEPKPQLTDCFPLYGNSSSYILHYFCSVTVYSILHFMFHIFQFLSFKIWNIHLGCKTFLYVWNLKLCSKYFPFLWKHITLWGLGVTDCCILSSGMWRHVVWCGFTSVLEEPASVFYPYDWGSRFLQNVGKWINCRYCPGICIEELGKRTNLRQGVLSLVWAVKPESLEYEAGVLLTQHQCLIYSDIEIWLYKSIQHIMCVLKFLILKLRNSRVSLLNYQ